MKLTTLRTRTRRYVRDVAGKRFPLAELDDYINEGVDRLRSYVTLSKMPYVNDTDEISYLPEQYQYILALYASSRCFEVDHDFYQAEQKRNEFENTFADLIAKIENDEIKIYDEQNVEITTSINPIDYVVDIYFNTTASDTESSII